MLSAMFDELLRANRRYASTFALRGIPASAAKQFALVTCMDSRIEPLDMLGLRPGDAKILRNAGARVTEDVLRSLILATRFLGVREIAVMQHTNCALADRDDEDVRSSLGVGGAVRTCGLLPAGVRVEGWRYDVESGSIHRVVPSAEG